MIPLIASPYVNRRDLLRRMVWSIDYPVHTFLTINNTGREDEIEEGWPPSVLNCFEIVNDDNLGVAGSWNQILNCAFNSSRHDYVMIVGNDIEWNPGDLQMIHEAFEKEEGNFDFISANWAFSTFGITRRGFDKLGWFDENYSLGYLEDADMWRRVGLSGAKCVSVPTHAKHGDGNHTGSMTINSDPELKRVVTAAHSRNWDYHCRKWGGRREGNTEKFQHPFNDATKPLWHWELSPERLKQPHYRTHG